MSYCLLPCKILVHRLQIWIPEIEYYQKMFSHAQIGPKGDQKQQSKINVGGDGSGGGGGWVEMITVTDRLRRPCQ